MLAKAGAIMHHLRANIEHIPATSADMRLLVKVAS